MKNSQKTLAILVLLCFSQVSGAKTLNLTNYTKTNTKISKEDFLKDFPYQSYLAKTGLGDIATLEKDRKLLNEKTAELGDDFILTLVEFAVKNQQNLSLSALEKQIQLAEKYFAFSSETPIYEISADIILNASADILEKGIKSGTFSKYDKDVKALAKKLEKHQYIIDIPQTQTEKLMKNVKEGNWAYIWDRIQKDYFWEFWLATFAFIALINGIIFRKRIRKLILRKI